MIHAQRLIDMLSNIGGERLLGHPLHNVPCQRRTIVGVGNSATRCEDLRRLMGGEEWTKLRDLPRRIEIVLTAFLETRGMSQETPQRDGLGKGSLELEVEIPVHIDIEVELSFRDELHHRRANEGLG